MTGPVVNSLATQQLKNMLKMGSAPASSSTPPPSEKSRDIPANVARKPTIPPDNVTRGFKLKRTQLPKLDNYQKATIEEPKKVDLMELFKMSGVNLQQMPPPLTPEQIEHMPIDELVTKDLDEIVGDEVTRDESIDQIQKQLNLVLKLENKVQNEAPISSEKAEDKPKKPSTPRLAMNFANAKK